MPKNWQKGHLNMKYGISNTNKVFQDFIVFSQKYNIENPITSRHLHGRCQEWCHSKDNFTWISKMTNIWQKRLLNMNYGISNTISFFKDFSNFAEKYNIEKAITSRHLRTRRQEWSH